MRSGAVKSGWAGRAAMTAAAVILYAPAASALLQHAPAPRPMAPVPVYPGPPYMGPGFHRPIYPGYPPPAQLPPGHLGDWLNQHRNLPVAEQERALRDDPAFRRLSPADQQRVIQQLHQVNQLTEEQRQRRLARAEIIEHLSPQ